ncbi:MAG: 4Fe-4S dicluster domain-containing protein [Deltaproteobacteria bacterium]|nr:4Fe-4S dicluster domain-containing protein [Deltaproteobacteria bacterium]
MQTGFYFDQTRCTGCYTCVVACKDWHDIDAGPVSWRRVITIEKGKYPNLFVAFLSAACYHCLEPACADCCPVEAISKREEDGIVVVDSDICLGKDDCGACDDACPYDAPQFGPEEDAKMQKCNLCLERLEKGEKPVCVESCPMRALDSGPVEELKAKYGNFRDAEGFVFKENLKPCFIINPKVDKDGYILQRLESVPISRK